MTNHWIPASAGMTDTYKLTPAKAGAGMTNTYKLTPAKAGAGMTNTNTQSSFPRKRESIPTNHTY